LDEIKRMQYADELLKVANLPYFIMDKFYQYINYKLCYEDLSWEEVITYVNIGLDQEFYVNIKSIQIPHRTTVLVNKYYQLPDDYFPYDLEEINKSFRSGALLLRHDARIAFEEMCNAAKEEGIHLEAISTFRSFCYQEQVYRSKYKEDISWEEYQAERDKVSARAGHSEHQTGLAVDINDLEETFADTLAGRWLATNSHQYGFILRYPKGKEPITGYSYEPWHFRYVGCELSDPIYFSGLTYDEYFVRYIYPIDYIN
jgi:zinc D-Ala-D-Ala carboxypeptidase